MAQVTAQSSPAPRARIWVVAGSLLLVGAAALFRALGASPQAAAGMAAPAMPGGTAGATASETGRTKPTFIVDWEPVLHRDLFDATMFVAEASPAAQPVAAAPEAPRPSMAMLVAEARSKLMLQATMVGPRPIAIINGQTHHLGDTVNGYRITRIEQRRIAVVRDDIELEIIRD